MGFGMSSNAWAPQVEALETNHRVIRFDNRGVARSGRVKAPYQLHDMAQDGLHLLDLENIDKAHVVGVSMGGMIAQHLALNNPDRIRSLTLIATHPGGRKHFFPRAQAMALFIKANTSTGQTRIDALTQLLYPPEARAHFKEQTKRSNIAQELQTPVPKKTLLMQLKACAQHDTRSELAKLATIQTLIVKPEQDIMVKPHCSDYLHANIPNSKLISFPTAGHGITEQCATELNHQLLTHFARAEENPPNPIHR